MKYIIDRNEVKVKNFNIPATGFIPEHAVLREVNLVKKKGPDGKMTDEIEAIRYECIDPLSYGSFSVKVFGKVPVISEEELEASEQAVRVEIPVDKTIIRPYQIDYGTAKVSIISPYIKLFNE